MCMLCSSFVCRPPSQPSFARLCALAPGADPLAENPAACGSTATTNGNSTLLIIGGSASAGCPQPPFDANVSTAHAANHGGSELESASASMATSVAIGGVPVFAAVVPGSGGSRLIVTTPTIAALQAARGESADAFVFRYYDLEIVTAAGGHGHFAGAVAAGPNASRSAANDAQLACAARGFCPDVAPASAGLYYIDSCVGWPDPTAGTEDPPRWAAAEFATLYAYDRPPNCRACPTGCRCPGGTTPHSAAM